MTPKKSIKGLQDALNKEFETERSVIASERKKLTQVRIEVNREVSIKQAKLKVLEEKLAKAESDLQQKQVKKLDLGNSITNLEEDIDIAKENLKEINQTIEMGQRKLEEIEKQIAKKQDEIDPEIEAYRQTKSKELEGLDKDLEEIKSELESVVGRLHTAKEELNQTNEKLSSVGKDHQAKVDELDQQAEAIKKEITELTEKRDKIKEDVNLYNFNMEKLRAEDARLSKQHEEFVKYEKKAWASLKAKDEELQAREANLKDEEVLLANRRSYLPPM